MALWLKQGDVVFQSDSRLLSRSLIQTFFIWLTWLNIFSQTGFKSCLLFQYMLSVIT